METFFHGGTELPNVMFMYMQYAGWMARMDGRRIERARARIEEGRERGVGGRGEEQQKTITTYIKPHAISLPSSSPSTNITFPKNLYKSNIPPPQNQAPQKCNSSPSSPPQPSQPLPLRSSRPGVERKSAPVEHHTVANWTFWASLLFLARMVST